MKGLESQIKPFLESLGYMPKAINNIGFIPYNINSADIISDPAIVEALKKQ
jgi:hypothetical protein